MMRAEAADLSGPYNAPRELRILFHHPSVPGVPPVSDRADRIDALLPQTQCGQCGYRGCRPYAQAMDRGEAAINRCPPGSASGIAALAGLLGVPELPLDPTCGTEKTRMLARVVEADCIGCTKCIHACPVDAIVGAPKLMHTVLAEDCTGCELCVPACPVDCIVLEPMPEPWANDPAKADAARAHFQRREARLVAVEEDHQRELAVRKATLDAGPAAGDPVQAALARARARQSNSAS